jgi:hypothetical protein
LINLGLGPSSISLHYKKQPYELKRELLTGCYKRGCLWDPRLKLKGFAEWRQPISARKISMASEHQDSEKKNNTVVTNATPQ